MDVPPDTAPLQAEINPSGQEPVPTERDQASPITLAVMPIGPSQTPPGSLPLLPMARTPEQEVTVSKEVLMQAELMEAQLGELYKTAGVLKSNIRVSTRVSVLYFHSDGWFFLLSRFAKTD